MNHPFAALEPWTEWKRLQREFDRLLTGNGSFAPAGMAGLPVEVFSGPDGALLRVRVPGLHPESLRIEVRDERLTIALLERSSATESAEPPRTALERSFRFDFPIDRELVAAALSDGLLEVRVPRVPRPERVNVPITVPGEPAA